MYIRDQAISRRTMLQTAAMFASASAGVAARPGVRAGSPAWAYAGTSAPNGDGIHLFAFDPSAGKLTHVKVAAALKSPSWIAVHPNGKYMYAVNSVSNFTATPPSGSVTALSIDRKTGDLAVLNVASAQGSGPTHLSVDPLGDFVFVANYAGGSFSVLRIRKDGSLDDAAYVHTNTGQVGAVHAANAPQGSFAISGHDTPHGHMIECDAAGKFVFGADLGQDRIYIWRLERSTGKLVANTPAYISLAAGDGPRHFAFHPNRRFFYALQEESSTLALYDYNAETGSLTEQQTVSTLPPDFAGTSFASEVRVSHDGKFVYAANRLHDTISYFRVASSGRLARAGQISTMGDYPRSFTIDPSGRFLISCNQRSDNLTTFRIRPNGLVFTGQYTPIGTPTCIVFLGSNAKTAADDLRPL